MKKENPMKWRIYVESTRYLEVKKHPEGECGFLETRRSGPVLDVIVCVDQRRYGIEVMIESRFRDRTVSSYRIVNGINKYVTDASETISLESVEHRVTGNLVAKARPQLKLAVTVSPISILVRERNWIDINQDQKPRSDYCDMVHQFLEKMLEQCDLMTWQKSSRQSLMVLRNGQLKVG